MLKAGKRCTRRRQEYSLYLNLFFCSLTFLFVLTGCASTSAGQRKPSSPQTPPLLDAQRFVVSIQGTQTRHWKADDTGTSHGCTFHAYGSGVETLTFHTVTPLFVQANKQGTDSAILLASPDLPSTPPAPTPFEFEMATSFAYQGSLQGDLSGQCTPVSGCSSCGSGGGDYCSQGEHPLKFVLDYHGPRLTLDESSQDQARFKYGSCNGVGTRALAGSSALPPVFGTLPASVLLLPQIQPYSVHVHVSQPLCSHPCSQGLYQDGLSNVRPMKSDDLALDWTATFVSHSCNFPQVRTSAAIGIARQMLLDNSPSFQGVVNQLQQQTQKSGGQVLINDKQEFILENAATSRIGQSSEPHHWQSVQLRFHWSVLSGIDLMESIAHEYWHAKETLIDHGFQPNEAAAFMQPEQFYELVLSEEDGAYHFQTKVLQELVSSTNGMLRDCARDTLNSDAIEQAINNGDEQRAKESLEKTYEDYLQTLCKASCDGYPSQKSSDAYKAMLSTIKPQVDDFLKSSEWGTIQQNWATLANQIPIPYHH